MQRRLNSGDFFRGVIFFHRCLRTFHGLFRRGDVDFLRLERHVGQNRNAIRFDLDESFPNRHHSFTSIFDYAQLARFQRRQHRHVFRINTELAFGTGQCDHVHVLGINFLFRRNDFQFQSGHGYKLQGHKSYKDELRIGIHFNDVTIQQFNPL